VVDLWNGADLIMPVSAALFMDVVSGGALDSATIAWAAAVVTNGGTVSAGRKTLVDTLIKGLKSDGVWIILDRLWIFAAENQPSALTDLVHDVLATAVSSPSFTVDRGFTPLSTVSWEDTNFNPSAGGQIYAQNAAHVSVWDNTTGGSDGRIISGGTSGADSTHIYNPFGGSLYARINSAAGAGFVVPDSRGHVLGNRSGASATQTYRNGSSLGSDTAASAALLTQTFLVGNDLNSGANTNHQISAVSLGGSLSATNASNLYTRLRTYMTAVGVP
jgi:hypothetical protein